MENVKPDLDVKIADMDFGVSFLREAKLRAQINTRIKNSLQRGGIMTLGQLAEAQSLPDGLGVVCHEVIRTKLRTMGLKLKAK